MRVVHVTTVPVSLRFLGGLVDFLRARGYAVTAISSPGPELGEFADRHGVEVRSVEMERRITPARDLAAVGRMTRELRRLSPSIVHSHTPKGGLLGMVAATIARVPVRVYHMRGLPMMEARGLRRRLLGAAERTSCRLAHRVFCVSHSIRDVAVSEGLCSPDRIRVAAGGSGQGVDALGRFDPGRLEPGTRAQSRRALDIPDGATVVGFVGRLAGDKGVVELEAAWRRLREAHPASHLLLVGPWEEEDPVPPDVRARLERDPRVRCTGMREDTPSLYAAMDAVTLPSYREGFPNVPLEAAAFGLPVVTTTVAGCADAVLDGVTGTLVPPRDAGALADALDRYLADPDFRRRHGAAGRERVLADFVPSRIFAEIEAEYRRLMAGTRAALAHSAAAGTQP